MKRRISRNESLRKLYDKTNRIIKGIDETRRILDSSPHTEKLLQIEMDAISVKKMIQNLCPLPKGETEMTPPGEDSPAIMIVDDEEMILQVSCLIIAKMGLRPLAFSSSVKALEYYNRHGGDISLIILDMIMPEMNGNELFRSMKKINPAVKGLMLSGWSDSDLSDDIKSLGFLGILHKPIEKKVLEEAILRALDS